MDKYMNTWLHGVTRIKADINLSKRLIYILFYKYMIYKLKADDNNYTWWTVEGMLLDKCVTSSTAKCRIAAANLYIIK
jgi:hypothetical protein